MIMRYDTKALTAPLKIDVIWGRNQRLEDEQTEVTSDDFIATKSLRVMRFNTASG